MTHLSAVPAHAAFVHVTHWKAGSQWIRAVLTDALGSDAVVPTQPNVRHLWEGELRAGKVYPCAYLERREFELLGQPGEVRRVVVIRDLRDTLVSWYFSIRNTHNAIGKIEKLRWFLNRCGEEEGLIYMMQTALDRAAVIQHGWLEAGERVLKFEAFMADPAGAFQTLFREHWGLEVPGAGLAEVVGRHSFSHHSGGRKPGEESLGSHYRKGVHGDWRGHFTPAVKDAFKARYGNLLTLAGYEAGESW